MNYQQQLQAILTAANWPQERLAAELGVSFPALNAWLNNRATPRPKAQQRIESLYFTIIGAPEVTATQLAQAKQAAQKLHITVQRLLKDSDALHKLTLHLTYHTNNIEGSTMTMADVGEVLFDNKVLSNRSAIEQAEARNHQAALHWLLDAIAAQGSGFAITEALILGLQLRLMNGIVSDAGQYRRHSVRIMGAHVALANWQRVPDLLAAWVADLKPNAPDMIAELARSHAQFEKIHPFSDGNGRTGRLLLLAQSLQAGLTPPLIVKDRKQAYYKYLERAQTSDDQLPLELFLAESMQFCAALLSTHGL